MAKPATPASFWTRLRRRLLRTTAALAILSVAVIGALPTLLSTAPARLWLMEAANRILGPGRLEMTSLSLSWTQPIRVGGVSLSDTRGKRVFTARSVRLDRGILGMLLMRPAWGTIRVDGATVDIERHADGSIDILQAISGLMNSGDDSPGDPRLSVAVEVEGDRLRIASPELAEAITASSFQATVAIEPGKPLETRVTLGNEGDSLKVQATYDHRGASGTSPDLSVLLACRNWPLAVREAGVTARGRLVGTIEASQIKGLWSAHAETKLLEFLADGAVLAGDRLALESVSAACEVAQTSAGWTIHKMDVRSPVASVSATGTVPAGPVAPTRLEGHLDLAALTKRLPRVFRLRDGIVMERGQIRVRADLTARAGADRLELAASLADLAATKGGRPLVLHTPASLIVSGLRSGGKLIVESFSLKAAGIDATATGDLERGLKLTGAVDLAAAQAQVRDVVDFGALDLSGRGRLAADYRPAGESYQARFAAEFAGLKVAGLTAEPILRSHVRIDGAADGPRGPDGRPTGWHSGRLGLKAEDTHFNLRASAEGDGFTLAGDASTLISTPIPARTEVKIAVRKSGAVIEIRELRLAAVPTDTAAASAQVALAATGRLNLGSGELVLLPIPGPADAGIGLATEGLKVVGIGKAQAPLTLDAVLFGELAALDRTLGAWFQAGGSSLGGNWSGRVYLTRWPEGNFSFDGRLASANLTAPKTRGPVGLNLRGAYATAADRLDLASFDLSTMFGRVVVNGQVTGVSGERSVNLAGTVDPRWETLDHLIAATVEPHAKLRATVRPIRLKGPIAGGSVAHVLKTLDGEIGLDLASAEAFGIKVSPTPIVLRIGGGRAAFDTIRTTINDGPTLIDADLYLDDPAGLWLRLAKGTKVDGAAINDAVSDDVLSYIAPVLSKASEVRGKVSLTIDGSAIPLVGTGATRIDGLLSFQDVVFQPGAFAEELFTLTGQKAPSMTLHQPLQLNVAGGRVKQSGLTIPLAGATTLKLGGSVGFDQTLALQASVPVSGRMIGRDAAVKQIVGDTNISVPIGGTISRPAIDRAAFRVALRDVARSMARRGVQSEAGRLLDRVAPSAEDGSNSDTSRRRGGLGRDALKGLGGLGREILDPGKP